MKFLETLSWLELAPENASLPEFIFFNLLGVHKKGFFSISI